MTEVTRREPRIAGSTQVKIRGQEHRTSFTEDQMPEDMMDKYKGVIGDGLARVTVSVDFGAKDFGNGASVMTSVSLACDQSLEAIQYASELARSYAQFYARHAWEQASKEATQIEQEFKSGRQGLVAGTPKFG